MLEETNNPMKVKPLKLEENIKNLYISLKFKMKKESDKPKISDYFKDELEKLKRIDITILMDYLKEMIDIYADYKTDKALFENNQKIREENISKIGGSNNDIEMFIDEKEFDCLTIKHNKTNKQTENLKTKDYLEYEKIIKKLEAEIRNRIQIENELKIDIELLEVKLEKSSNIHKDMKIMQKKLDSYEAKLKKQEYLEYDKKENEILILRAENSNLKKYISEKETELMNLKNEISEFRKESHELLKNKKLIIQKLNSQINKYEKNLTVSNSSSNTNTITNTNINSLNTNNTNTIQTTHNHNVNSNLDFCQALTNRNQYLNHEKDKKKDKNTFNKSNNKIEANAYSSNSSRMNLANIDNTIGNVQLTTDYLNVSDIKKIDKNINLQIKMNNDININNEAVLISNNDEILKSACSAKNQYIRINEEKELIVTNDFKHTGLPKKDKDNKSNLYKSIFQKLTGIPKRIDEENKSNNLCLENNLQTMRKQTSKSKQDTDKRNLSSHRELNVAKITEKNINRNISNNKEQNKEELNPQYYISKEQINKEVIMKKTLLEYSKLIQNKKTSQNQPNIEFSNNLKILKNKITLKNIDKVETPKNVCFSTREKASSRRGLSSGSLFPFPKYTKDYKKTIEEKDGVERIQNNYRTPSKNKFSVKKKI